MNKQELFTKASYEYLNLIKEISDAANEKKRDKKDFIYGIDILVQLSMLNVILLDNKVSELEIEFLSKFNKENDLIDIINKRNLFRFPLKWETILELSSNPMFEMIINTIYSGFKMDISNFMLIFISLDITTSEDYLNRLKGSIYNIVKLFLTVDGLTDVEEKKCYSILNDKIFKDMDSIKDMIYKANDIKIK